MPVILGPGFDKYTTTAQIINMIKRWISFIYNFCLEIKNIVVDYLILKKIDNLIEL